MLMVSHLAGFGIAPLDKVGAFATFDPAKTSSFITLSGSNLVATANSGVDVGISYLTIPVTQDDKTYVEFLVGATANGSPTYPVIGVRQSSITPVNGHIPGDNAAPATGAVGYSSNGNKYIAAVQTAYGSSYTAADTIGVAIDGVNGACYFRKGATWQNSGDPTSGSAKTGAANTWTPSQSVNFVIAVSLFVNSGTAAVTLNAGATAFTNAAPAGYTGARAYS